MPTLTSRHHFFGAKFQRNIEELLVAPVPTHVIIAGYVGGGVARGLFVGILVTAISLFFVPFQVHSWVFVALTPGAHGGAILPCGFAERRVCQNVR